MLKSYGINKTADATGYSDVHLEEFRQAGYTVIENVLSSTELELLRNEVQRVYTVQEESFGKENLEKINEKNLARALLCYSEPYLELARNAKMIKYVEEVLGKYYILHLQNGVINMPGEEHHQSSWHRDFPYQNWVSTDPIGCNVFYCLDDFSKETGGTFLLPFSHKMTHMPTAEYLEKHSIQIIAKAGSAVLFDSMLFHKAGFNSSKSQIRRGINHLYARAIVRQQISLPEMLKGKYSDDPYLNMLLGYDAQSPSSVDDFRNRRLKKNTKSY
jgi:ectoine hydroxylase-related dioxygenase (phytanoyl-CoA dioxygenase family)